MPLFIMDKAKRKLKLVKQIDIFSSNVRLNINGDSAHKTFLGVLCTLLYLGGTFAVVVDQITSYFDTTSPIAVTDSYTTALYPKINIFEHRLIPALIGYSNETEFIEVKDIDKYFTIIFQKTIWKTTYNSQGVPTMKKTFEEYPTVPCKSLAGEERKAFDYINNNELVKVYFQSYGVCAKVPPEVSVEGKGADDFYTTFSMEVMPCSLPTGCKTYEESSIANLQIILPTSNYDSSNKESPLSKLVTLEEDFYINPSIKQTYTAKIQHQKVSDLVGLYPYWTESHSTFEFSSVISSAQYRTNSSICTKAQAEIADNPACLPYFEYTIQSSGVVVVNRRSYPTIFETLGNIGGTSQVFFIVLLLLYSPYDHHFKKKFILNKVYPLLGEKDVELGKQTSDFMLKVKHEDKEKSQPGLQMTTSQDFEGLTSPRESSRGMVKKATVTNKSGFLMSLMSSRGLDEEEAGQPSYAKQAKNKRAWSCCCRKRTLDEQQYESRVEAAFERIESSLDVLTILRSFNLITVLAHLFFDQRHFELSQYVGFDLWRQEVQAKREGDNNHPSSNQVLPLKKIESEKIVFVRSLEELQATIFAPIGRFKRLEPDIKSMVNAFYFAHLFGAEETLGESPGTAVKETEEDKRKSALEELPPIKPPHAHFRENRPREVQQSLKDLVGNEFENVSSPLKSPLEVIKDNQQ